MIELNKQIAKMTLFPLKDNKKDPKVKWKDYTQGLDDSTVTYGINCEKSNIIVIDVDMHGETDGISNWKNIVGDNITNTFTTETPNNGQHYYYITNNKNIKNSASKLAPGVDVRGAGGYIVGPGSQIVKSDGTVGIYKIINDVKIELLPDWLYEKITTIEKTEKQQIDELEGSVEINNNSNKIIELTKEQKKDLASGIEALLDSVEGSRNDTLNKVVYRLVVKHSLSKETIEKKLKATAISIGLEIDEIDKTIDSAYEAAINKINSKNDSPVNTTMADYTDTVLSIKFGRVLKKEKIVNVLGENIWYKYNENLGIWEKYDPTLLINKIKNWGVQEANKAVSTDDSNIMRSSLTCLKATTINAIYKLVASECEMPPEDFDSHPELIVCQNGVVNLRTGELLDYDPNLFLTKRVNTFYDTKVKSKYLEKILSALPNDAIDWFIEVAGQALTDYLPSSDRIYFLNGVGANGKSTLLNLLNFTAGDYGGRPPQESLVRTRSNDSHNLISFKNIRQAIIEEMPDKQLDTVRMKMLTGTESVTARGLYKDYETFKLHCTIFITCNILPQVTDYDYGTWRRITLIPFNKVYKENKNDLTSENYILADNNVRYAALNDEDTQTEFFTKRVLAAKKWFDNGMIDSPLPKSIIDATNEWKNNGDNVFNFFNKYIENNPDYYILVEDMRDALNSMLVEEGYSPMAHKTIMEKITTHSVFIENNLKVTRSTSSGLTQSTWYDPKKSKDINYSPRKAGRVSTHVKGIKFK